MDSLAYRCTKWQLFSLLTARGTATAGVLLHPLWYVDSVQREDGSGNCFNVRLNSRVGGESKTIFVRTTD